MGALADQRLCQSLTTGRRAVKKLDAMMFELLSSKEWRSLGINERRLMESLILEYMRGKPNGELLNTWEQLTESGISAGKYIRSRDRWCRAIGDYLNAREAVSPASPINSP